MDLLGDHAICCRKTRDTTTRHNRMRNWVFTLAKTGLLNPILEKENILGDPQKDEKGKSKPNKRRPGDVFLPLWRYGNALAIDVAVICPVAKSHLDESEPCEYYGQCKHDR